ncbi:hypothetical protein [Candidatus Rariloculus sp.]|uniref:hypothetical protein n=1 Tax=Candidatus Rariloculus sp. TaxID=3101265 RepID=UPI003D0DE7FF
MQSTHPDPVIAEVRAVRDRHAARFGYDVKAIFRDIRSLQKTSGREVVRYPARAIAADATQPRQAIT